MKLKSRAPLPCARGIQVRLSIVLMLCFSVCTDQYTKFLGRLFLDGEREVAFAGDMVRFTLVKNHHGFLGIAGGLPAAVQFLFLYVGVSLLLLACLRYLFFCPPSRYTLPLIFVTGGGLSNLLDRLLHGGGVTDFISIGVGTLRTGIFNLADLYILLGAFAFGYLYFSSPSREFENRYK